jgi:hypothetical protein
MLFSAVFAERGSAQQIQLTSPYQRISDSFYENFGIGWGVNRSGPGGGWFFNTGPSSSAIPPFGGYDPAADAHFGFGGFGGGMGFNFGLSAGQGSTRTNSVVAPTLVIPNGGTGGLFSGSVTPFVTAVVPVVGGAPSVTSVMPAVPMMPAPQTSVSPLQERIERLQQQGTATPRATPAERGMPDAGRQDDAPLVLNGGKAADGAPAATRTVSGAAADSSANHGDISVAEIRRQQAAEDAARQEEIAIRLEKARGYEEAGKPGLAKIYYQQAAARAEGEQKKKLLEKIRSLGE